MVTIPASATFPPPPLAQITPFTFREGATLVYKLYQLQNWMLETLIPHISQEDEKLREWLISQTNLMFEQIQKNKDDWDQQFEELKNDLMSFIAELNDGGVALLVNDESSQTGKALIEKFATLTKLETRARQATVQALAPSASVVIRSSKSWGGYEVLRIFTHGQKIPGLIEKKYPNDYETQGTTGNGFRPGAYPESLTSVHRRTGAGVIINADGWVSTSTSEKYNLTDAVQIKDGVIYHDFMDPVTYFRGYDALGFRWDGSVEFYSAKNGDTAQSMVADGVKDSFCFGPALVVNGAKQTIDNPDPGARQILGVMPNGDIMIVSTTGVSKVDGPTYQQAADLAHELGMKHAIPLDGGGSTQTLCNGFYMHPSNDTGGPRQIGGSFLLANVTVSGDSGTSWQRMNLLNNFTHHVYSARFRVVEGTVKFSGAIINETATGDVQFAELPWYAKPSAYQRFPYLIAADYQQYYNIGIDGKCTAFTANPNLAPRFLSNIDYRVD